MVYIPGPGSGNNTNQERQEKKKIRIEKPVKREKIIHSVDEKRERPVEHPAETENRPSTSSMKMDGRKEKRALPSTKEKTPFKGDGVKTRTGFLPYFLMIIAVVIALMAFFRMIETENAVTDRMNAMSAKYNEWYQEIKQQTEENSELLKPNGVINKTLIASNLMNEYIVGIDDIINARQENDFSKVAFARLFISGSNPVYISVEGNSKVLFAKNINPGLSEERFYYYKQPQTMIEDKTIVIPRNFKITSGNYENTYLLFFNFGDTKLVKMDAQKISNVISKYNIWLPAN
ncbi:MAG TPA: hypothetical protein PK466_03245 [Thermotogota bacterium]|nr:hypothetical protein [Thermotogota bacterium]HPJ88939.1 hypothetical protein [Thermotogota bacterium]HPR95319.1 hypothetical protein [Thermotogota bacterium]